MSASATYRAAIKRMQELAICTPSHKFAGLYLRNQGMYRQSEKHVKQQYLLHMHSQYGELRHTDVRDWLAGLGHTSKFQRGSRLGFVTAATSLNVSQTVHGAWPSAGLVHSI